MALDRDQCGVVVNMAVILRFAWKAENFFRIRVAVKFSRNIPLCEVF
jgi:hypothetical protein